MKGSILVQAPSKKVLLIDDDRIFSRIVKVAANEFGLEFSTRNDVPSKRKIKGIENYDFLLLDYDLEGSTGFEFAELLQKEAPYVPIILISSSNRPIFEMSDKFPNVIGFISKWTAPEEFLTKSLEMYQARLPLAS